ncbi:MAG TPA: OsmC family protein [Stellaceae bacterium]|nr:OsmC family protein [Stellaceae bacterium]
MSPTSADTAPSAHPVIEPGTVLVMETREGRLGQWLLDGRHRLLADEPKEAGGDDAGPGPYELLLMSLGACTAMTLRLYAERKGWPLERVLVRLRHSRVHAADCVECDEKPVLLDHIDRTITLEGALDAAQRDRLMAIADKCPVHRTLSAPIRIETHRA